MTNPESTKPLSAYLEAGEIEIRTGPFGTQLKASEYVREGTPVINVRNIGFGTLRPEKLEYLPEKVATRLHQHRLKTGDIVFGRKGAVERHLLVKADQAGWIQGSDCIRVRIISGSLNPNFLSYNLLLEEHQSWIKSQASHGATMATLNQGIIERIRVPERTPSEQQRIADILTVYDDLIEVNQRRIAILGETARRLFDEWFVRFRYPGHEAVALVETELGMVPEGWKIGTVQDVVVLQRGFDLPHKERSDGPYPVIAATGEHGLHSAFKVVGPGVVTGRSGSLGKVMHVSGDFWPLNTTLWGKEYPLGSTYFAYFTISNLPFSTLNAGAAVPSLNRNHVHLLPIVVPSPHTVALFDSAVAPMFALKRSLQMANAKIRNIRDLLLPKLISGEISLGQAKETFEEAAE